LCSLSAVELQTLMQHSRVPCNHNAALRRDA
jgi:hypothetical protein